jgi:phytoene dehydrogenase-like protein
MTVDVLIVGAGHNGLVAGSYLARDGRRVLIVEASATVGGMTSTNPLLPAAPQHRINEGAMDASLIRTTTIPQDLELARFGWREVELDPPYVWLDQDGSSLCIWRDPQRTADELRRFSPRDARAFLELANELEAMMAIAIPYMNTHPLHPAVRGLTKGLATALRHPARLLAASRLFAMSHAEVIEERFEHRSIRAMLAALPCFAPITQDGTGWVLIYFGLIHAAGVGRYITGTGGITDALDRCFRHHGGEIRTSAVVEAVLVSGRRAQGVRLDSGEELHARAVITTCNVKSVLTAMLPDRALAPRLVARANRIPTDGTRAASFKFDLALSGRVTLAEHHANRTDNVDLRKPCLCYTTFEEHVTAWTACERGEIPPALPMISILPTAADPTQAPDGQDTVWSWTGISAAHPRVPWPELKQAIAQHEIDRLARFAPEIPSLEIARQVMSAPDFEKRFRSPDGNVYHVDPTAMRFGPLRPALGFSGFKTPIDGVVLSGGGMHPSAGICGIPGKLAAHEAAKQLTGKQLLRHRAALRPKQPPVAP